MVVNAAVVGGSVVNAAVVGGSVVNAAVVGGSVVNAAVVGGSVMGGEGRRSTGAMTSGTTMASRSRE